MWLDSGYKRGDSKTRQGFFPVFKQDLCLH